jgi:hypothetical protein
MRKQKSMVNTAVLAHQETAQNGALLTEVTPKMAPCSPSEPSKTTLARSDEGLSKALLTGSGEVARHLSTPLNQDFQGEGGEQGPFFGGGVVSKDAQTIKSDAVSQYLSGPSWSHGSLNMIQPHFFPQDAAWLAQKLVDLAEQRTKAEGYLERIIPAFTDPVPSEAEQVTRWKRYFKTAAITWEYLILKEYAHIGQACPRGGFKGKRCYTMSSPKLLNAFMAEIDHQQRLDAPVVWHGQNVVQLAEADFVVVVD